MWNNGQKPGSAPGVRMRHIFTHHNTKLPFDQRYTLVLSRCQNVPSCSHVWPVARCLRPWLDRGWKRSRVGVCVEKAGPPKTSPAQTTTSTPTPTLVSETHCCCVIGAPRGHPRDVGPALSFGVTLRVAHVKWGGVGCGWFQVSMRYFQASYPDVSLRSQGSASSCAGFDWFRAIVGCT